MEKEPLLPGSVQYPVIGTGAPDLSAFRPAISSQEGEGQLSEWAEGQYATGGGGGGSHTPPSVPPLESASLATVNEIRAAASSSQDPYPQWIYGALVSPEASTHSVTQASQDQQPGGLQGNQQKVEGAPSEQWLTEEEIREILTDYVGKQGCWGGRPAHEWPIGKVEDCNVYIGTLETFIETRVVNNNVKSYSGGPVDDEGSGQRQQGPWEIDMRHEFPLLFTLKKEARLKVPHSESVQRCSDCVGRKEVVCPLCNKSKDANSYVSGQTTECSRCHGRGLLAHQDGSDTKCGQCQGKGQLPCAKCNSRGLIRCGKCEGSGALLEGKDLIVTWTTLKSKKISTSSNASLVPDEVFHEAKGVQLYSSESYQCQPASFPHSHGLTQLSSDVIAERNPVPPSARIICERHQMHMIPVTRVSVNQGKSSFKFFIVGLDKQVYLKDYPASVVLDEMETRPMGPGAVVSAGAILFFIGGLTYLWKLTRRPHHSRQFIMRQ